MCIHAGEDELDSVRALMTMSLNAIVADVFGLEPQAIRPTLRLHEDLGLDDAKANALRLAVAEYFDGLQVDAAACTTLGELFTAVVDEAFEAGLLD